MVDGEIRENIVMEKHSTMESARRKSLAKNSIYNTAYRLINAIFSMVTAIYVSRVLTPELVGRVSYAENIVQYFVIVAALGIPNYGSRELVKITQNKQKRNLLFWELFVLNAIATTCCLVVYGVLIYTVPMFRANITLYYVVGTLLLMNYFNIDWFLCGYEEYAFISKRGIVIKVASVLCLFVFVRDVSDYLWYAVLNTAILVLNYVFGFVGLYKYGIGLPTEKLKVSRHLKPILIILATEVAVKVYSLMDTTMLGIMCREEVVAYYTYPMRLVRIVIIVAAAVGSVLLPRLSYYFQNNMLAEGIKVVNDVFYAMLFLLLPCGIGMFMVADTLIPLLFGSAYLPAVTTLRIGALLTITLGFSDLFGTQILVAFGGEKKRLTATIVGAIMNIALNLLLIPMFAQNGAAAASVISEGLVTIIVYLYAGKHIKIEYRGKTVQALFVSSASMMLVLWCVKRLIQNSFAELVLSVILGAMVYFMVNLALGNKGLSILVKKSYCN